MLRLAIAFTTLLIVLRAVDPSAPDVTRLVSAAATSGHDVFASLVLVLRELALLGAVVSFCFWINRTTKYLRPHSTMEHGPNAWGWFFCPVLNLWRPYQVVAGMWSAAGQQVPAGAVAGELLTRPPAVFRWWWGLWLFWNFASSVTRGPAGTILDLAGVIDGYLAVRVIHEIQTRTFGRAL